MSSEETIQGGFASRTGRIIAEVRAEGKSKMADVACGATPCDLATGRPDDLDQLGESASRSASPFRPPPPRPVDAIDEIDEIDEIGLSPSYLRMIRETSDWVGGVDGVGGVDVGRDVGIGRAERGHPRRTAGQHHDRIDLIDRSSRPDCQEIKGPSRGAARYDECRPRRSRAAAFSRRVAEKPAFC